MYIKMSNDRELMSKSPQAFSNAKPNILTKTGRISSYLQNIFIYILEYVIGYFQNQEVK